MLQEKFRNLRINALHLEITEVPRMWKITVFLRSDLKSEFEDGHRHVQKTNCEIGKEERKEVEKRSTRLIK